MRYAILGNTKESLDAKEYCNNLLDDEFLGIVDTGKLTPKYSSNIIPKDKLEGCRILDMTEIWDLCRSKCIDKVIIPGYPAIAVRDFEWACYDNQIEPIDFIYYSDLEYLEENIKRFHTLSGIITYEEEVIPLLGSVEYEVAENCNLNCKRCNHYSNLFDQNSYVNLESFRNDLTNLKKYVYNIRDLKMLGGEPLLNPELCEFLKVSKQIFPKAPLNIITNGILILNMGEELIDTIVKTNTIMKISVYPPLKNGMNERISFMEKHGIQYIIYHDAYRFASFLNPDGDSDKKKAMRSCYASTCHTFKRGKLYKCASDMNVNKVNEKYNTQFPDEFLLLEDKGLSGKVIKEFLMSVNNMCSYCGKFEWYDWEQASKSDDITMNDWVSKLKA